MICLPSLVFVTPVRREPCAIEVEVAVAAALDQRAGSPELGVDQRFSITNNDMELLTFLVSHLVLEPSSLLSK